MIVPKDLIVGSRIKSIPGEAINAGLYAARELQRRPMFEVSEAPTGGTATAGAAGTAEKHVAFLSDFKSWGMNDDGEAVPTNVVYLPYNFANATFSPDLTASLGSAVNSSGQAFSLGDTSCCNTRGGDDQPGGLPISGMQLEFPVADDNRIKASNFTAGDPTFAIRGSGCIASSTYVVTVTDGTTTRNTGTKTPESNGDWSLTASEIATLFATGLNRGAVKVSLAETTEETIALPVRSYALTYVRGDSVSDLARALATPTFPRLIEDSTQDTNSSDNTTDDRSPQLEVQSPVTNDPLGPSVQLFADADPVGSLGLTAFDTSNFANVTSSTVDYGRRIYQHVLTIEDPSAPGNTTFPSGTSPPLNIRITADLVAAQTGESGYFRLGRVVTIDGTDFVSYVGPCPFELTDELRDKRDGVT